MAVSAPIPRIVFAQPEIARIAKIAAMGKTSEIFIALSGLINVRTTRRRTIRSNWNKACVTGTEIIETKMFAGAFTFLATIECRF